MKNISRVKCVVVGESTVGKSAIAQMFVSNGRNFPKTYLMTRGIEICSKMVNVPDSDDAVEFFLFDSSGKEVYADVLLQYWKDPDLIIVVFDVTDETTFELCEKWLKIIQPLFTTSHLKGVLVANKVDKGDHRVVSFDVADTFAKKHGLHYLECSAKDGKDVEGIFIHLAQLWLKSEHDRNITTSPTE